MVFLGDNMGVREICVLLGVPWKNKRIKMDRLCRMSRGASVGY